MHHITAFSELMSENDQVSRSSSVPPNTRDALYQGLPPSIKSALRSKLQSFHMKEEVLLLPETYFLFFRGLLAKEKGYNYSLRTD